MVTGREDVVGLDSSVILPAPGVGGVRPRAARSTTRWSSARTATSASAPTSSPRSSPSARARTTSRGRPVRGPVPELRHPRPVHRAARLQHDAQDLPRPGRVRGGPALPAARRPRRASSSTSSTCRPPRGKKPPFGIGQIGKSFRNEITPGNFIFRTREFEQMEMEYFVEPGTDEELHQYWIDERTRWYVDLGIDPREPAALRAPEGEALPLLEAHGRHRVPLRLHRPGVGRAGGHRQPHRLRPDHALQPLRRRPVVLRPGHRVAVPAVRDRAGGGRRPVDDGVPHRGLHRGRGAQRQGRRRRARRRCKLDRRLAPVKAAVLPLSRNADLSPKARDLAAALRKHWNVEFDDAGAIGRRYRRQDEIGTPFCLTVDFDTLNDQAVTVRERDSMAQERVALDQVEPYLAARLRRLLRALAGVLDRSTRRAETRDSPDICHGASMTGVLGARRSRAAAWLHARGTDGGRGRAARPAPRIRKRARGRRGGPAIAPGEVVALLGPTGRASPPRSTCCWG